MQSNRAVYSMVNCRVSGIRAQTRLRPNTAREPACARVVDVEVRLQAAEPAGLRHQRGKRAAKLIRLRHVLGVVDDDVVAARELQRVLDGARLGARIPVRHHEDAHVPGQRSGAYDVLRLDIDSFKDEEDLEPRSRIVDGGQRGNEMRDDGGLAVERHQHGVERQQLRINADGWRLDGRCWGRDEVPQSG